MANNETALIQLVDGSIANESGMREKLEQYLNDLLVNDFNRLVQLLYRLDIDEQRLRAVLRARPEEPAGRLMAALLLEREEEKRKSRQQFSQRDQNVTDEEKW